MIRIEFEPDRGATRAIGPEVEALVNGRLSTAILVVLGFRHVGVDTLEHVDQARAGESLVKLVQLLGTNGIRFHASQTAAKAIERQLTELRAFRDALAGADKGMRRGQMPSLIPPSFKRTLLPFQIWPVNHLIAVPNAANFSVPGSGKTTMLLAAYAKLLDDAEVSCLFVVCPRAAFQPWRDEFESCFGRAPKVYGVLGDPSDRTETLRADRHELYLCTYQMAAIERDNIAGLMMRRPTMLVIDESHHIKKGPGGVWFDAVLSLARHAVRRVVLTGTPAPNSIEDLVAQFEVLWPGLNPIADQAAHSASADLFALRKRLKPFYTRVKKSDLGLPPRELMRLGVKCGPVQRQIYDSLSRRIIAETVRGLESSIFVEELRRALIVRLMQAAVNPGLLSEFSQEFRLPPASHLGVDLERLIRSYSTFETPMKFVRAKDLVSKIVAEGRKVVVWTSFVHNATTFARILTEADIGAIAVTGLLSSDENDEESRERRISQFKQDPKVRVMVATTFSVGESVSLHGVCQDAVYLDRTFNAGLFMQSMDRIHRVGLPLGATVRYYVFVADETIDEVIDSRLGVKIDRMHRLLDDDIGVLELDVDDESSLAGADSLDIAAVIERLRQDAIKRGA